MKILKRLLLIALSLLLLWWIVFQMTDNQVATLNHLRHSLAQGLLKAWHGVQSGWRHLR